MTYDIAGDLLVNRNLTVNGTITYNNQPLYGLQNRTTITATATNLASNITYFGSIVGFKSYALLNIASNSTTAWIRIYANSASQTADASRSYNADPLPSSGVLAEIITSSISTSFMISPAAICFNMELPPTTSIAISITNLGISTTTITATLTILQLEV